jgi:hypothetical protein
MLRHAVCSVARSTLMSLLCVAQGKMLAAKKPSRLGAGPAADCDTHDFAKDFEAASLCRRDRGHDARKGWMANEVGMQCRDAHVKEPEDQKASAHDR